MRTYYELMDVDSANVVDFFDTKDDALAAIRDAFERFGLTGVEDLALSEKSADKAVLLGEGAELLSLARNRAPDPIAR